MSRVDLLTEHDNRFNNSRLYGLRTVEALAEFLRISVPELVRVARNSHSLYREFDKQMPSGGLKHIESPHDSLKMLQKSIQMELRRVPAPIYLTCPVKGRSPVSNAARHRNRGNIVKLDIKSFFPSTQAGMIYDFFFWRLRCSIEVSNILTRLVCFKGHLPTGAPTSPYLAFYAYEEVFNLIYVATGDWLCRTSQFADDFTISGQAVGTELIGIVESCLNFHYFRLNRSKSRLYLNTPAIITGVVLMPNGELRMRNRMHKAWYEAKEERKTATGEHREYLMQRMKSLEAHRKYIERHNRQ